MFSHAVQTLPSAIVRRKEEKKRYAAAKAANSNPNSTTGLLSDDNDINDINYGSTVIDLQSGCNNESTAQRVLTGVAGAPPPLHTLLVPRVMITMTSYGFLAFVDMCVHVLQPLVYSTSIPLGGLGFDPYRIGTIMGAWGLINALVQGLLLGPTVRQFGARKSFIASQISYVASLASYPLLTFFARRAGRVNAKVWVVLIVQLILRMASGLAYGTSHLGRTSFGRYKSGACYSRIRSNNYRQQCSQGFPRRYDWHGSSHSVGNEVHRSHGRFFVVLDITTKQVGRWKYDLLHSNRDRDRRSTCKPLAPEKYRQCKQR